MSLRFKGHYIVDEEGDSICIPYWTLKRLCIKRIYKELSSFEIIKDVVKDLTGRNLARNGNTESQLFLSLEKAIRSDPAFKQQLEIQNQRRKKINAERKKENQYFGKSQHYIRQDKIDLRNQSRKRFPWYWQNRVTIFSDSIFLLVSLVHHPGLEPGTFWLRVNCSTNWANGACPCKKIKLEATPGFEPGNQSFADSCLTTWLCRHTLLYASK